MGWSEINDAKNSLSTVVLFSKIGQKTLQNGPPKIRKKVEGEKKSGG